jgi:SPOR domain
MFIFLCKQNAFFFYFNKKALIFEKNLTKMRYTILLTLLFSACFGWSQKVTIKEDPIIAQMMEKFTEKNKQKKTVAGWRIQIGSTTDRRQMDETVKKFQQDYPEFTIAWVHAKPYYQVRAGAFKTKLESLRLLSLLKSEYPEAYPVADTNIKQAELAGAK